MTGAKRRPEDLAILGGDPLFTSPRPIGQLDAPPVEDYLRILRRSFESRRLTNDGPAVQELEQRLCDWHQVGNCISVANAALGLTMLMQLASRGRPGDVAMPAFSFRGLPHLARWAGQTPLFCDVDPATHTLDPADVADRMTDRTSSILAVCNFNDPGDLEGLGELARRRGAPLIIDSVYGFGATHRGRPLGGFGTAEVFSLHATKLLNGFEGGYITTNDDALATALRWQRNFALPGLRPDGLELDHVLGLNAKLNELHAAMALAGLDRVDSIIEGNKARHQAYLEQVDPIPGLALMPCDDSRDRRGFQLAILDVGSPWPLTRDETLKLLRAEGAAVGPYYSPPLHVADARGESVARLPVSEVLARRFVQLPVGELVSLDDIRAIGALLRSVSEHGDAVRARLGRV